MKFRILIAFVLLTIMGLSLSRLVQSKPEAAKPLVSEETRVEAPAPEARVSETQGFNDQVIEVERESEKLRESVRSIELQTQKLTAVIEDLDQVQKDYDAKQLDEETYFSKREEILNRLQTL